MILKDIFEAKFLERNNRFVGEGILNGKKFLFHIADTGRLEELLFKGNKILVQKLSGGNRKYKYRLISANGLLGDYILLNSLLHSALIREYLIGKGVKFTPEVKVGESKIDFLIEDNLYVEVKGCSLIKNINGNWVGMFPDAPTIRGQKHLKELINLIKSGKQAQIWFILANKVDFFQPNFETDKKFSKLFYEFLDVGGQVEFLYVSLVYKENFVILKLFNKSCLVKCI